MCNAVIVKVLLQCCETNKFLGPNESWIEDPSHAVDFEQSLRAMDALKQRKLRNVRIFLKFTGKDLDIPMDCMDASAVPERA
jgi:hypothetical protein